MTAIAMGVEPNEVYDELSLDDQDRFDRIAAGGFTPVPDGARWSATKDGERVAGPVPSLEELEEAIAIVPGAEWRRSDVPSAGVRVEAGPSGIADNSTSDEGEKEATVEIDEDHKGNTYLPGVKPVVDQQLADAAGAFHADDVAWSEAGKKRKASQAAISAIAELKRGLFRPDPDNSNSLIYHAGGLKIRIAKESKTKVTVEEEKDGD